MKKSVVRGIVSVIFAMFCLPTVALAFNSAAHLYIADQVFPNSSKRIDLHYGSIAPDLALYVTEPPKWTTAFDDTHYEYIDLRHSAWWSGQKAFARGWLTHNEAWGADYYAHIEYPMGSNNPGYVLAKAGVLFHLTGLDPEFGHFAIETAVDLLLKHDDPGLGEKLFKANLFRSWEDRYLLVKVLVRREQRTDWSTLVLTELVFRDLVGQYAVAYSLPEPFDRIALAEVGAQLAWDMYGIVVSPEQVYWVLEVAVALCEDDYANVLHDAIEGIKNKL